MYKITLGQLLTMWVFGLVSWVFDFGSYQSSETFITGALFFFIPFFLIFYTLGWIAAKKKQ